MPAYDVPRPPVERIQWAACPASFSVDGQALSVDGCAYPDGRVYVTRRGDKLTLWHERGHLVDDQVLRPGDRNKITRLMGYAAGTAWRSPTFDGPNERAADLYATCALGMSPDGEGREVDGYARHGPDVTIRQHRQVCRLYERVGKRPTPGG